MKRLLIILFLLAYITTSAQEGINFRNCNWNETLEIAKKENKLIFIDFYTQWCGPCYNMAKEVFVLHSVGTFYNNNFLCIKIDAENGEGIELAAKYAIKSYPTYMFICPHTQQPKHKSSGRQTPEIFIFTGKSALDSTKCSYYLEKKVASGCTNPELLLDYANYKGSIYDSDTAKKIAEKLFTDKKYDMANKGLWLLFKNYVKGRDNLLFHELISNISEYRRIYGKNNVDSKIYLESQYATDLEELKSLPDFSGKHVLMLQCEADSKIKSKLYKQAFVFLDSLMAYKGEYVQDVCKYLYFTSRSCMYGEYPDIWRDKCLDLIRYVAYNNPVRDDASIHQEYAAQLEKKLSRSGNILESPKYGRKEYNLRPLDLKLKPRHI